MPDPLIKDVSDTAFWIAHLRAVESERPDALLHDPLAGRLAGERGRAIAQAMPMPRMIAWSVAIRTCIIDDYVTRASTDGIDTVLNLGAGLDTRPYRMQLPQSLRWIEADYPQTIEYKASLLHEEKPHCRLERVPIDLAHAPRRRDFLAGVNASAQKMLVVTEGVIPYLSEQEGAALADDLRALNHVSYWVVDYFSPRAMKYRQRTGLGRAMQNAPFKFAPSDWFAFFEQHGWRPREIRYLTEESERLRRPVPMPALMKAALRTWMLFVSRERRRDLMRSMGYALLEPV